MYKSAVFLFIITFWDQFMKKNVQGRKGGRGRSTYFVRRISTFPKSAWCKGGNLIMRSDTRFIELFSLKLFLLVTTNCSIIRPQMNYREIGLCNLCTIDILTLIWPVSCQLFLLVTIRCSKIRPQINDKEIGVHYTLKKRFTYSFL